MLPKLSSAILLLTVWSASAGYQNQSPLAQGPDLGARKLAVDLVRVINTAEMGYRTQSKGSFAAWTDLSVSPELKKATDRFSRSDPKLRDIDFNTSGEIITGWRLRLTISPDSKSYVVVLADTSDKQCAYAVVSSEEGLIREARVIGCPAS
jgi:hypothetical protein